MELSIREFLKQGYIELIRKYQPGATIFNDHGPDVRWIGNETGTTRYAEWAVVPSELVYFGEKQTEGQAMEGDLSHMYNPDKDIGAISNIIYSNGLVFAGAEVDMSIRPGWFYHEEEEPHTVEKLFDTYIRTVGGNACFHLNIPPNQQGRFDERDVAVLKELGSKIRSSFSHNIFENQRHMGIRRLRFWCGCRKRKEFIIWYYRRTSLRGKGWKPF